MGSAHVPLWGRHRAYRLQWLSVKSEELSRSAVAAVALVSWWLLCTFRIVNGTSKSSSVRLTRQRRFKRSSSGTASITDRQAHAYRSPIAGMRCIQGTTRLPPITPCTEENRGGKEMPSLILVDHMATRIRDRLKRRKQREGRLGQAIEAPPAGGQTAAQTGQTVLGRLRHDNRQG
jgi:hypothetical protein